MTDFLKSDPTALRYFILFEVIQKTPIEKAYSKFCKVIGDDVMEYQEFDFLYFRFWNKEYDSNFEKDKNKNTYALSDMPLDVMENIVEYLDIFDRNSLSKTSRSFQTFVEDQKLFHHTLKLTLSFVKSAISFGESIDINYVRNNAGCKKIFKNRETHFRGVAHWKQAIWDIKKILNNPKLHLDTLEIESSVDYKNVFDDLEDALKFTHFLNVKNLILQEYSLDKLPNIIPSLKPGYLATINIVSSNANVDSMTKVFEMEQWKQAKYFTMGGAFFIWPLHHLYHFEEFNVWLLEFSVEDIRQMKEILFKSSNFKRGFLKYNLFDIDMSIFDQEFGNALRGIPVIYHYPIPNSTDYFEIKVHGWTLEIQRQKS